MARTESGLDRIAAEGPEVAGLRPGARVGLLAHAASITSEGRHALDVIVDAGLRPLRLFAPEHGLWGHEQDMERVLEATDPTSGVSVISLYGAEESSLKPVPGMLADLDAVLCDLQDVGSRYYTFVYTLAYMMEAAAEAGVAVIVLDRPNPLDGRTLEGPILDPRLRSFVGRFPLPVRHGMTIGELGRMFAEEFDSGASPRVVELGGWRRSMRFDETGLPWVPPSPNMPSLTTATVYPGACLIEGTNLSEGRGTTTPFELAGAPWLDGRALATELGRAALPGAAFRAASFRPMFQKHAGSACGGVQVLVRDATSFRSFRAYLELLVAARRLAPERFDWRREAYEFERERLAIDLLLGRPDLRPALEQGIAPAELERAWAGGLTEFAEQRRPFLLYGD